MKDKYMKIMFDYCATAIWDKNRHNIQYADTSLSEELKKDLDIWTAQMEKSMWEWDSNGNISLKNLIESNSASDIVSLCGIGKQLAIRVKRELSDWTIFYFDEVEFFKCIDTKNRKIYEYEITLEDV